eukprot:255916_1
MTHLLSLLMWFLCANAKLKGTFIRSYQTEIKKTLPYHAFLLQEAEDALRKKDVAGVWMKGLMSTLPASTVWMEVGGGSVTMYCGETEIGAAVVDIDSQFAKKDVKALTKKVMTGVNEALTKAKTNRPDLSLKLEDIEVVYQTGKIRDRNDALLAEVPFIDKMKFNFGLQMNDFKTMQKLLFLRNWKPETGLGDKSFFMVQFNILADALSTAYNAPGKTSPKDFLGVDTPQNEWRNRGPRLIAEIIRLKPDVITLQEVDRMDDLMFYLRQKEYGEYAYVWQQKRKAPIQAALGKMMDPTFGWNIDQYNVNIWQNDGVAILYKKSVFSKVKVDRIDDFAIGYNYETATKDESYAPLIPVALAVTLKHKATSKDLLFVSTHLASDKFTSGEEVREKQVKALLGSKPGTYPDGDYPKVKNPDGLPTFFGADLNALPKLNTEPKEGDSYKPLAYTAITGALGFTSMFANTNPVKTDANPAGEPEYTTFKFRILKKPVVDAGGKPVMDAKGKQKKEKVNKMDKWTIDYIFTKNKDFKTLKKLNPPNVGDIPGMPDKIYPSDHFAIGVQFGLRTKEERFQEAKKTVPHLAAQAAKGTFKTALARSVAYDDWYYDEAEYENGDEDYRFGGRDEGDRLDRLIA